MSTRTKKVKQYAVKLMEIHPNIYVDRFKTVTSKDGRHTTRQRFSGKRLAQKHARLGLELEKL